jgi:2-C-methyl-D-erythritol 4-phosphate cytidylyltransferase/2-C-methyl-D-erythritol 2,4-cyclodiphosphate synthase
MKHPPHISALLAAAGIGERLACQPTAGSMPPKAFLQLAGKPLFMYSLEALRGCEEISDILVIVPLSLLAETRRMLAESASGKNELAVAGGPSRQESVYQGLLQVPADADIVLIHDAARPFLSQTLISACLEAAKAHGAAICAVPATDTIKSSADGERVEATLERKRLWNIQTPQAFSYHLLLEAHENARRKGIEASDDAALVEELGRPVYLAAGAAENIKITHKADFAMAEKMISSPPAAAAPQMRVGLGFDAHAFAEDRKLVLAGMEFPGPGLLGHSDADVICHAVMDALLGAAGLGDIGTHFPDTDPQYAGASSLGLLEKVGTMVAEAGLLLAWLDIVVAAEEPKIAPHAAQMRANLARTLKIDPALISLKGKTTEGLGFTGRKEGIACWAVVMVNELRVQG